MNTMLDDYLLHQAATVGRRVQQAAPSLGVPHLPGAEPPSLLGVLQCPLPETWRLPYLALSPDNHTLVTGHGKGWTRVWDLRTGVLRWEQQTPEQADGAGVVVSPDGRWLAHGYDNGTVHLRDIASGQALRQW